MWVGILTISFDVIYNQIFVLPAPYNVVRICFSLLLQEIIHNVHAILTFTEVPWNYFSSGRLY